MADFSKQWCDLNDPDMPYDFDIELIAENLQNGWAVPEICEGFGFTAIGRSEEGTIILGFPVGADELRWEDYQEFINRRTYEVSKKQQDGGDHQSIEPEG